MNSLARLTRSFIGQQAALCDATTVTGRLGAAPLWSATRSWKSAGMHGGKAVKANDEGAIKLTFVDPDGEESVVYGRKGQSILDVAHANGIDLEGACESSLACSTCHVIVDEEWFDDLPEPVEEEDDMLDLAYGLTETSRLGCQIVMKPELDGLRVTLPASTRNFYVDGHKPQPH